MPAIHRLYLAKLARCFDSHPPVAAVLAILAVFDRQFLRAHFSEATNPLGSGRGEGANGVSTCCKVVKSFEQLPVRKDWSRGRMQGFALAQGQGGAPLDLPDIFGSMEDNPDEFVPVRRAGDCVEHCLTFAVAASLLAHAFLSQS